MDHQSPRRRPQHGRARRREGLTMLTLVGGAAWTIFGGRQLLVGLFKFFATPLGHVVAVAGALVLTAVASDVHARIRDHAVCNQRVGALNSAWQQRELE